MTSPSPRYLVNGQPNGVVPVSDRGLNYGDGLFETVAVTAGRPRFWSRHMERLKGGCRRLGIEPPDPHTLLSEALQVTEGRRRAVVKIVITRAAEGRGYRPGGGQARRIVSCHDWPEWPLANSLDGVTIRYCATTLGTNPHLGGVKHLNRLEQVLARGEWEDPAIAEGLMLDNDGCVVEGTMSNLFIVRDGVLHTPDVSGSGVAGVMRGVLLEQAAAMGIECRVGCYRRNALAEADELFLTNALIGVWSVRRLEEQQYPFGPLTRRLIHLLEERL